MIPTEMITDHLFTEVLLFKTNHQMSFQIVHIYMHACMHKSLYQHMKLWTKSSKHVSLQLVLEHGWLNIKLWLIFHIHPGNMVRHLNNLLTFVHTAVTFRQWTWTKVGFRSQKKSIPSPTLLILRRSFIRGSASSSRGTVFCACI